MRLKVQVVTLTFVSADIHVGAGDGEILVAIARPLIVLTDAVCSTEQRPMRAVRGLYEKATVRLDPNLIGSLFSKPVENLDADPSVLADILAPF